MVVNSSEELSLRENDFSHLSQYLGKWQQSVMLDYGVGVLVAVAMFSSKLSCLVIQHQVRRHSVIGQGD